jgi:hypothetical protein
VTQIISPINTAKIAENLVATREYIPGEVIYIFDTATNQSKVLYTVPDNYRLLISCMSSMLSAGACYGYISLYNLTPAEMFRDCISYNNAGALYLGGSKSYKPMLELEAGYKIYGVSPGAGNTLAFSIHGYLIKTYGGY